MRGLVCFIAYASRKTPQQWQSKSGFGRTPRTIRTEFARVHAADTARLNGTTLIA